MGNYYPLTDRGHVNKTINESKGIPQNKIGAARDFLASYD
jgi:hypothetical protein